MLNAVLESEQITNSSCLGWAEISVSAFWNSDIFKKGETSSCDCLLNTTFPLPGNLRFICDKSRIITKYYNTLFILNLNTFLLRGIVGRFASF